MSDSIWRNVVKLVPPPSLAHRQPVTQQALKEYLLPTFLCYYLTAVLVVLPRTIFIRLSILPVTLLLAYRCALALDFAANFGEWFIFLNQAHLLAMVTLTFRVSIWSFKLEPLRRRRSPQKLRPSESSVGQLLLDALDLTLNLRGVGWDWSDGLTFPVETRDVTSKSSFLFTTLQWFICNLIAFDLCHYTVQWFSPQTFGSPAGGSIFDGSLPLPMRIARAMAITFLSAFTVYFSIDTLYYVCSIIGIAVFQQEPMQWPPVSDKPWLSTSLNEFWAKRWHQFFRDCFVGFGGKPLMMLIGRTGAVMGVFLASGILHDLGTWGMGRGTDVMCISGFFLMNGIGVLLEVVYKNTTGKRVGGFAGLAWTYLWLAGWGMLLVDAWCLRGLVGANFFPPDSRPATMLLGPLF